MPMNISRRVLLKAGAIYGAMAALPVSMAARIFDAGPLTNIAQLSLTKFRPLQSEVFKIAHEGHTDALRLIQISDLGCGIDRRNHGECFSLLFQSAPGSTLRQGTYRFFHRKLGSFPLFIVPVNQILPDGSRHFEAIFNRIAT